MEPHRELPDTIEKFRPSLDSPAEYFQKALEFAQAFYQEEIDRISSTRFSEVTADFFFREFTWVVHATGFSAKAVGKFMPRLLEAYGHYATLGTENVQDSILRVATVCNNPQKIRAVHQMATKIVSGTQTRTWAEYRDSELDTPEKLVKLPYIGKVTCFHLARNIGLLECVKPDLHLIRMAEHWGFEDCTAMCKFMRGNSNIPLGIVDLVLWYGASTFGTLEIKKPGQR